MTANIFRMTLAILAITASIASAQNPTESQPVSRDEALLDTLQRTIVDVRYDRVDFDKVIQDLRDRYGLNIHVSWAALEEDGLRRDRRIEAQLTQVSLATLLDILLREAGAGQRDLSFHVENGVIIISTRDTARPDTVLRTYDVADLLESGYAIRRFANTPVLGLALTGREFIGGEERKSGGGYGGGGGGGGGGSIFGSGGGEDPRRPTQMERIEELVDLLTESVEPDSWDVRGGDAGSIRVYGSTFLIRHSIRAHQTIAEFFKILRSTRPQPLDAEAAVVRLRADKAAQWRREIGENFPRITVEQADAMALAPAAEGVLFRGSISGFNGQALWFSALTQRDVLTGLTPVVAQGINAFSPQTGFATSGLELIVLPLLLPDHQQLILDVQMAWCPETQVVARTATIAPGAEQATIDQSLRSMRTVSSTTTLRTGDAIVLTIPAELNEQGAAMESEDWLIVRVRQPQ